MSEDNWRIYEIDNLGISWTYFKFNNYFCYEKAFSEINNIFFDNLLFCLTIILYISSNKIDILPGTTM